MCLSLPDGPAVNFLPDRVSVGGHETITGQPKNARIIWPPITVVSRQRTMSTCSAATSQMRARNEEFCFYSGFRNCANMTISSYSTVIVTKHCNHCKVLAALAGQFLPSLARGPRAVPGARSVASAAHGYSLGDLFLRLAGTRNAASREWVWPMLHRNCCFARGAEGFRVPRAPSPRDSE
jgi:hypothetical protein